MKEYIILEKDGIAVTALMDRDEFEGDLDRHDRHLKRCLAASLRESRTVKTRPAGDALEELRFAGTRQTRLPSNSRNGQLNDRTPASRPARLKEPFQ